MGKSALQNCPSISAAYAGSLGDELILDDLFYMPKLLVWLNLGGKFREDKNKQAREYTPGEHMLDYGIQLSCLKRALQNYITKISHCLIYQKQD